MPKISYICAITAFATGVLSCSEQAEKTVPSSAETRTPESLAAQRAANAILVRFVKLDKNDERYYLDISREDALKLSVPEAFYDRALRDIETTNRYLRQYQWESQWHGRYAWFNKNHVAMNVHVTDPSEWFSSENQIK